MKSVPVREGRWTSLWIVALASLVAQLWLCQFFSFGVDVPTSIDINPANLWKQAYHFPPTGTFQVLNWLGVAYLPQALQPLSLAAALLPPWWFFTAFVPLMGTAALLAMVAFLRELGLTRPAALFGGVIYAWQGDLLPFVYPGHFAYISTWVFFAVAAWGALRATRTRHWAYALISGAGCGLMVSLQPDRGGIASLLVALLYVAGTHYESAQIPAPNRPPFQLPLVGPLLAIAFRHRLLLLCMAVAGLVALAPLLALFQSYIQGVKLAGSNDRRQTYDLVTQYSLGPAETLTYLVPGFFGWHSNHPDGPYWGWIGEWPDWPKNHQGTRNLNLAISTTGTIATVLALLGIGVVLSGGLFGPDRLTPRLRFHALVLLAAGAVTLVLSWGWHTGFYRPLFALPLMDKWRNPLKWLEMTNFALVVLSAIGLEQVLLSLDTHSPEVKTARRRLVWYSSGWLALLVLGLALTYPLAIILSVALKAEGYDYLDLAGIMTTLHVSVLAALLSMAAFHLVLLLFWRPERLRTLKVVNPWINAGWQRAFQTENLPASLAVAIAILCAVQLGWVARQFVAPISLEELVVGNPLLEALRAEHDTVRVSVSTADPLLDTLLQNQFNAMGISSLDISAASRIPDDLEQFYHTLGANQSRLFFLAGVKNLAIPEPEVEQVRHDPGLASNILAIDGYTLEQTISPELPSHAIVHLKDYLNKVTLAPRAEIFNTDAALLDRLKDPSWNPRLTVLLRPLHDLPPVPPYKGAPFNDQVELGVYTPTEIEIRAQSSTGGFLLINDHYDPDWQVTVNGRPAELLRADYLLRAVKIPAGDVAVSMHYVARYHPPGLPGISLSAAAVNDLSDAVMLAAWIVAGLALRRARAAQPSSSLP